MKFLILILTIFLISAFSFLFKSNNNDCKVRNSENSDAGNSYDVRVGRNISLFVENNKIYLNYNQNEIIKRYFELNSHYLILKVLHSLSPEVGFSDGTVNNSVKRNFDYISDLSANSNLKGNHIFFSSDNYVSYNENIEEKIVSMIKDQIYVVSGEKVGSVDLNSKVNAFIRKLQCGDSNMPEVEEWNINDMHIILEADGKQIKNSKYNSLNFLFILQRKRIKSMKHQYISFIYVVVNFVLIYVACDEV